MVPEPAVEVVPKAAEVVPAAKVVTVLAAEVVPKAELKAVVQLPVHFGTERIRLVNTSSMEQLMLL
jgi:hypothetical protein